MSKTSKDSEIEEPIDVNDFVEDTSSYSTPAQKSIKDIANADANDDSLKKYKEQLLGSSIIEDIIVDPDNPSIVILKKLSLIVDEKVIQSVDFPAKNGFTISIKEGCVYKISFEFYVQREIVSGLKYLHKVSRLGIGVTKETHMLGSYGPSKQIHVCETSPEESPSGIISRGEYRVTSLITDDDKHRWMEWDWLLKISKDW